MGTILHAGAKTTHRIRKEIHDSKESIATLAARYGLNPKTIIKWRKRDDVNDLKSGPKKIRSSLTEQEQAIVCEFRRISQFPLDDILVSLRDQIPTLTRSNLHRCLQRNGLSRRASDAEGQKPEKKKFKEYDIGYVHVDIAQLATAEGKASLFVAVERKTRYAYAELYEKMNTENTVQFLKNFIAAVPFKIHTVLTDNGAQFTYRLLARHLQPKDGKTHPFDDLCAQRGIRHRLTQFNHPWTNGLVERMNRSIKEQTVKIYFYEKLHELRKHLELWLLAYNFQKKLKSLNYQAPCDVIGTEYERDPSHFLENLNPKIEGPYKYSI
jgi:transposase-like protein